MGKYKLEIKSNETYLSFSVVNSSIFVEEKHYKTSIMTGQTPIQDAGRQLTFSSVESASKYPIALGLDGVDVTCTITDDSGNFVKKDIQVKGSDRISSFVYVWYGLSDCSWC
eukprot:TRINITY_DN1935_c0_g1_i1.p1 TRINITY_DN1935_c0_g1~~TRINITY_DN1935_c0_g1_i1.p1  ORF type:complete len:112 (-),score=26.30 TRINITY_DN1935_c0_g1_i1:30-365(-)